MGALKGVIEDVSGFRSEGFRLRVRAWGFRVGFVVEGTKPKS